MREGGVISVCVCVCVCEREREKFRRDGIPYVMKWCRIRVWLLCYEISDNVWKSDILLPQIAYLPTYLTYPFDLPVCIALAFPLLSVGSTSQQTPFTIEGCTYQQWKSLHQESRCKKVSPVE